MNVNINFKAFNDKTIQYFIDEPVIIELDSTKESKIEILIQSADSDLLDNVFMYWQ